MNIKSTSTMRDFSRVCDSFREFHVELTEDEKKVQEVESEIARRQNEACSTDNKPESK